MSNKLTPRTVANYAYGGGFRGNALVMAVAIAGAETGGVWDADAVGINTDRWRSRDRGLWQINDHWHPEVTDAMAFNPAICAREAYRISHGGTNWKAWATYNGGQYKRYLADARLAVSSVTGTGSTTSSSSDGLSAPTYLAPDTDQALTVVIGGQQPTTALGYALLGGTISYTTQEASQLVLRFDDNDYDMIGTLRLIAGALDGTPIDALGRRWRIQALGTGPGDKGPQTTLTCQPSGVIRMRGITPPSAKNMSPTDYMALHVAAAGLAFRGEQSAKQADIGPTDTSDALTGDTRKENAWEIGQRLASALNYVAYEANGVYHFGSAQFIAQTSKLWQLSIRDQIAEPVDTYGDPVKVWGWPAINATRIGTLDFPQRTLDCQISQSDALLLAAGDQINLAGIPTFPQLPALANVAREMAMTITQLSWDLGDTITPARLQAADRSQFFEKPATAADQAASGLVVSDGAHIAGVVGANSKSALDFVTACLWQIGDTYVWGAHPTTDPNPDAFDCSGLVGWAAEQVGISFHGSSGMQYAACKRAGTLISVNRAANTRGAVLFEGPSGSDHIAVSLGDGKHTIEARGRAYGVNKQPIDGRPWSAAALIPRMRYS